MVLTVRLSVFHVVVYNISTQQTYDYASVHHTVVQELYFQHTKSCSETRQGFYVAGAKQGRGGRKFRICRYTTLYLTNSILS